MKTFVRKHKFITGSTVVALLLTIALVNFASSGRPERLPRQRMLRRTRRHQATSLSQEE